MGKIVSSKSYYELSEHNTLQISLFFIILFSMIIFFFVFILNFMGDFFSGFLNGQVFHSGEIVSYSLEEVLPEKRTDYLFSWAVDIYVGTPDEARYWFNPILSLFIPISLLSVMFTVFLSALMPRNLGFVRQKIEREIASALVKIAIVKHGHFIEGNNQEIADELLRANIRDLHDYVDIWDMSFEDLKTLYLALKWRNSSFIRKILSINDGLRIYMRNYFVVQYGNTVLGFVYMGAAVLIIIIGLRGLKFIPPTQPSLVLFALGLEFSLLIIYAATLMYSRLDEESEGNKSKGKDAGSLLVTNKFGNSKEIESLLRVFIKKTKRTGDN